MRLDQFYALARNNMIIQPAWRYGQSLFNSLLSVRPDLAEKIRATDADPFYVNIESDDRMKKFTTFLKDNWEHPVEDVTIHEWEGEGGSHR